MDENEYPDWVRGALIGDHGAEVAEWLRFEAEREAATHGIAVDELFAFRALVSSAAAWELNRERLALAVAEEGTEDYVASTIRPDVDEAATHLRIAVETLVETWETLAARAAFEANRTAFEVAREGASGA